MNYRLNYWYPLLVWFLTVLTAPIIIAVALITEFSATEIDATISFVGLGIAVSAGLSLPTLFVYYLVFLLFNNSQLPVATQKSILAFVAILGFVITFEVIGLDIMEFSMRDLVLPLSFVLSILFFSFLFPMRKLDEETEDTINNLGQPAS